MSYRDKQNNETFGTFNRYLKNSWRLLTKSTKKPTRKELSITSRIVAIGILVVGLIGFIIDALLNVVLEGIGAS